MVALVKRRRVLLTPRWRATIGTMTADLYAVHPEVEKALAAGLPVVALESTLFVHGLPPHVASQAWAEVEEAVRSEGAVPAVLALLAGRVRIGIDRDEWPRLQGAEKASIPDLARLLAEKKPGATTVASTAFLAWRAGIQVMATGGIGGVHRDGRDISADLFTLARCPLVVVCSGAKSVLDLPATVEALEALGIPVMGFRTSRFPGFYLAETELPVPEVKEVEGVAALVRAHRALDLQQAVLVVQAPPEPMDRAGHDRVLDQALQEAEAQGVRGKALTPFLLERMHQLTGGRSAEINRKLVVANARLAAQIAVCLTQRG